MRRKAVGYKRVLVRLREQLRLGRSAPAQARALLEPLRDEASPEAFEALRLVVSDLVANCVQHGGSGGGVTVEVCHRGESVERAVTSPTGLGRPRLAETGYRAGRARVGSPAGAEVERVGWDFGW